MPLAKLSGAFIIVFKALSIGLPRAVFSLLSSNISNMFLPVLFNVSESLRPLGETLSKKLFQASFSLSLLKAASTWLPVNSPLSHA